MAGSKDSNEIDLLHLLIKILKAIRSNLWLIIIFFVIGCLLGFVYSKTARKVYESEMIISSTILTDAYSKVIFENVNKYLGENSYGMLSKQFSIPEEVLRNVGSLRIKNLSQTNENKERDRFMITADVFDTNILPQLQQGVVNFLHDNEFAKVREEQQKKLFTQMVASVDQEIKELNDLKTKISNGQFFQSAKGNVMFDPTTVNSKIVELTEKKLDYENKLQLVNSVQVIDEFTVFRGHSEPRLSISVTIGAMIGLVVAFLVIAAKALIIMMNSDPE